MAALWRLVYLLWPRTARELMFLAAGFAAGELLMFWTLA